MKEVDDLVNVAMLALYKRCQQCHKPGHFEDMVQYGSRPLYFCSNPCLREFLTGKKRRTT